MVKKWNKKLANYDLFYCLFLIFFFFLLREIADIQKVVKHEKGSLCFITYKFFVLVVLIS